MNAAVSRTTLNAWGGAPQKYPVSFQEQPRLQHHQCLNWAEGLRCTAQKSAMLKGPDWEGADFVGIGVVLGAALLGGGAMFAILFAAAVYLWY